MQISFSRHLIQLSINSASKSRGFHGICRKSFLPRQVCFANLCGLVGERFSPTPPFFSLVWRAPGDVVLPSRVAAAALPPYLSASGGQLFIARWRALRQRAFAALRSPASYLLLAPLPQGKGVRSHPLRGAYRAYCAGQKRCMEEFVQ